MKKTLLEQTILRIFVDYEDGELPDDLDEWISKYIPLKKRKTIDNKERCSANTHQNKRCIKRIYNDQKSGNTQFCYQHHTIMQREKRLQYGIWKDDVEENHLNTNFRC